MALTRRMLRGLIRHHNIAVEPGDCFSACVRLAPLVPATVVQGLVVFDNGTVMGHTWLQTKNYWIDPTMGQFNTEANYVAPLIGIHSRLHQQNPKILFLQNDQGQKLYYLTTHIPMY